MSPASSAALGDKAATMIVSEASYETSAPTISSQLATLKASGANVMFGVVLGKFTSQMIKGVAETELEAGPVLRADLGVIDLVPGTGGPR